MSKIMYKDKQILGCISDSKYVSYDNTDTGLSATNAQDAITELNGKLGNLLTATITSGDTSATITDSKIKSTSIIDIYFENKVLAPENVTVSDGSIIVEISAQDTDTVVGVRVI